MGAAAKTVVGRILLWIGLASFARVIALRAKGRGRDVNDNQVEGRAKDKRQRDASDNLLPERHRSYDRIQADFPPLASVRAPQYLEAARLADLLAVWSSGMSAWPRTADASGGRSLPNYGFRPAFPVPSPIWSSSSRYCRSPRSGSIHGSLSSQAMQSARSCLPFSSHS